MAHFINFIYIALGCTMTMWYTCVRWTIFANKTAYPWAYAPINLTTAFLSIPFLIISLFTYYKSWMIWMFWLGLFLFIRNMYYSIEDARDLVVMLNQPEKYSNKEIIIQLIFIIIDLMMALYVAIWLLRYQAALI